jgi:hypothetical protein
MARIERCGWLALASLTILGASLPSCGGSGSCIEVKCASGAWLHIPLSSPAASLAGAVVTVYRNGEFHAASLPAVPSPDSAGASVVFPDTADLVGTLWQEADQSVVLDLEWHLGSASQAADGDHYVVTLTDAASATTTLLDKTATYQPTAPDPRQCAGAATCSIAMLTP